MKYRTNLNNLEFFAYHGLYEEEKVFGGRFFVDVSLEMDTNAEIVALDQAFNYEIIFSVAREEMAQRQDLIETVAQRILGRLSHEFKNSTHIEVTISKPNPAGLFGSGVASVTFRA